MNKISVYAYLFTGALLAFFNALNVMILSPPIADISSFPLLLSVRLISIAHFLERLDPFVILLLFIGLYVKTTLWYLAAVLSLAQLFRLNHRWFVVPVGAAIYFTSFLEPNYTYHIWFGIEVVTLKVFLTFSLRFPLFCSRRCWRKPAARPGPPERRERAHAASSYKLPPFFPLKKASASMVSFSINLP